MKKYIFSFKKKMSKNNLFLKSLSTITNINKELEKRFNSYDLEDNNFLNDEINKIIINSIFSLLNFQITIINQLAELNSQISEKTEESHQKLIEKLINFTKELLYQKIKQILMFNHNNNIMYKNYIDNSSSLKLNNDKMQNKKKLVNLNRRKFLYNIEKSLEKDYNYKSINKTMDLELNTSAINKSPLFQSNNLNEKAKEKKNVTKPFNYNEKKSEKSSNRNIIKQIPITKYIKKRTEKTNNKIINKSVFKDSKTSKLPKKKYTLRPKKKDKDKNISISLCNEKISKKSIENKNESMNSIQSIININSLLPREKEREEINPIRKVKNIIKNIKINSNSLSIDRNKTIKKRNNKVTHDNNLRSSAGNYSIDSNSNQDSKQKNSFSFNETENNENGEISFNIKTNNRSKIYEKELETSQILQECMNNVKRRLMAIENKKSNKKGEENNLTNKSIDEYKVMKHQKIKKL